MPREFSALAVVSTDEFARERGSFQRRSAATACLSRRLTHSLRPPARARGRGHLRSGTYVPAALRRSSTQRVPEREITPNDERDLTKYHPIRIRSASWWRDRGIQWIYVFSPGLWATGVAGFSERSVVE